MLNQVKLGNEVDEDLKLEEMYYGLLDIYVDYRLANSFYYDRIWQIFS